MTNQQTVTNQNKITDSVVDAAIEWYNRDYVNREACTASEAQLGNAVRDLRIHQEAGNVQVGN